MKNRWIVCGMLALFSCGQALGQQPPPKSGESHKYRTLFTLVGGGGGFAVGALAGLAAFDDAINSDRKVWTTAALSAVGGAVGGYFLGRALDKRKQKTNVTGMPGELERSWIPSQWSARRVNGAPDSWQDVELQILPMVSCSAIRPGWINPTHTAAPYPNGNYLYLLSALRKIERAADLCTLKDYPQPDNKSGAATRSGRP